MTHDEIYKGQSGMLYCNSCDELCESDPDRISYPSLFGERYQIKTIKDTLKRIESIGE